MFNILDTGESEYVLYTYTIFIILDKGESEHTYSIFMTL